MLVLSIAIWCVVVYTLRTALRGSPPYRLVTQADPDFLQAVTRIASGENVQATPHEFEFLKRFSRLTLLELGMFVLEITILIFLFVSNIMEWLSFFLLLKNLGMIGLGAAATRGRLQDNIFESLRALPSWLITLDRISALISAIGGFILFLAVNDIVLW